MGAVKLGTSPLVRFGERHEHWKRSQRLSSRLGRWLRREEKPMSELDVLRRGLEPPRPRRLDRWFPPRQFLIRGPVRTGVLHLSTRLQIGVAATCSVAVTCFLVTAIVAA